MKSSVFYLLACLLAALAPFTPRGGKESLNVEETASFPGWDAAPVSHSSSLAPLTEREARFAADFPGRIGVFNEDNRVVLVRWLSTANRKLHPAADCLRASGYTVEPGPLYVSEDHLRWGTLTARRGRECLRVRERIVDAKGNEWTDVSNWYWHAILGRSTGPWWAISVFESGETRPPTEAN